MKVSAIFYNESCLLEVVPETNWDTKLLGAVAGKTGMVHAAVDFKHHGHFSYQEAEVVRVVLSSTSGKSSAVCGEGE